MYVSHSVCVVYEIVAIFFRTNRVQRVAAVAGALEPPQGTVANKADSCPVGPCIPYARGYTQLAVYVGRACSVSHVLRRLVMLLSLCSGWGCLATCENCCDDVRFIHAGKVKRSRRCSELRHQVVMTPRSLDNLSIVRRQRLTKCQKYNTVTTFLVCSRRIATE